jgi:hypothetical protein
MGLQTVPRLSAAVFVGRGTTKSNKQARRPQNPLNAIFYMTAKVNED